MEDDLEYYITFPTPTPKDTAKSKGGEDDDFVFVSGNNGENREPVVFLLGWLGANDRHLAKYCGIYKDRGCITIRYTSPPSYIFLRPNVRMPPIARKLVALLTDMNLNQHPIFFHVFSNNGSVMYYYISEAMNEADTPNILVKGCIFDSTPAPRRVFSGVLAVYEATAGPRWKKFCASMGMMVYLLSWKVISILWTIISGKLPNHPPWSLVEEKSRWPQLFLYSKSDKLIPAESIEYFIDERRKLGVPVSTKCWIDSPHVQHYRIYPEEYRESVYAFLSKCLSQDTHKTDIISQPALPIDNPKSIQENIQHKPKED